MKTTRTTLLLLALLALAAPLALAQPGPGPRGDCPPPGDGPGFFGDRVCAMLDLSEEQQAAIDEIRAESRAQGLQTRKEILRLRNELDGLMLQDDPDAGSVEKLVRRIGDLRADQQVRRMKTRLAVRAQLTDEQRDKMITMKGHRRGGRGGYDGPGRGGGRRAPRGDRECRYDRWDGPRGR